MVHPVVYPSSERYTQWYTRVVRGTPWCICPGTYGGRYTTLVYTLPIHPGYTPLLLVHPAHACRYPVAGRVAGREALGSTLGLIREYEAQRGLLLSFLLRLLGTSAQSYSASRDIKRGKIG